MPISFTPTAAWSVLKPPQYVEETSFGVTPSSPVFKIVGSLTGLSPAIGITKDVVRSVGRRDPNTQVKMMEGPFSGAIKYRPFDSSFMKYGVNLPDDSSPAGTNAASVTLMWSQLINGTEKYFAFQGVKTDKISIEVSKDGGVQVGQDLKWYKTYAYLSDLTTLGITTPTYVSTTPSTQPWSSLTGGTNPFTIESAPILVDRFKIDVNQNLYMISPNGSSSVDYWGAGIREISIDFDTYHYNNTLYDYLMNLQLVSAQYTLNNDVTTPSVLTLTNVGFDSRNIDFDGSSKTEQREGIQATPNSVTLS